MKKQRSKFQSNDSPNMPFKLKIKIGNKTISPKNSRSELQNEEMEVYENDDFEVNLEEEIVENEEDVVTENINYGYGNEEDFEDEKNSKSEDEGDKDSENDEVELSQDYSECVNDEEDDEGEEDDEEDDEDDDENNDDNETANEHSQNDDEDDEDEEGEEDDEADEDIDKVDDEYNYDRNSHKSSNSKLNKGKNEQKTKHTSKFSTIKTSCNNKNNNKISNKLTVDDDYDDDDWLNDDEDVDYRKYKSACGLTVRQRALFHGEKVEELMELSTSQRVVELSEEQMLKRRRKALRRRQLAEEKDEKEKRSTLDKLLKKQDSKLKCQKLESASKVLNKDASTTLSQKSHPPPSHVRITINHQGTTISLPLACDFPPAKPPIPPPKRVVKCGVEGCKENKRYSCSSTNTPLCSLQCYRKNLSSLTSLS